MRLRVRKTHPVMTIISTKNKMKNIAIIYGSDSSEWEVSIRSGEFTASQFDREQFNVYEVFARFGKWVLAAYREGTNPRVSIPEQLRPDIDKTDFSVNGFRWGSKLTFDFVYIMQHGTPGENGLMQGYFEMLGIPFYEDVAFCHSKQRMNAVFTLNILPKEQNLIVFDDFVTTGQTLLAMRHLMQEHSKNCVFFTGINNKL